MKGSYDPPGSAAPRTARRAVSLAVALPIGLAAFILLIIGGIFVMVGQADYSAYTGRAEAVVSARETTTDVRGTGDDRRTDTDIEVYVDYEAEGQQYTSVRLSGLNPDSYHEGERLTVAYDPAAPGDPVTAQSTEEGAFDLFLWLGVGLLAVGGVGGLIAVVLLIAALRR
ncbi:DUF3592 domain-containing protein [Streptomonospora sp. PA3]|uniref:DUF3592 domain-containing protein n=1 Tax=Streptomonospora sp. PA3 TaxID=2607326 RepID=UPI0016425391|nr:DUF3592 domain-containing protein [Streptomonospora sp. PA3]